MSASSSMTSTEICPVSHQGATVLGRLAEWSESGRAEGHLLPGRVPGDWGVAPTPRGEGAPARSVGPPESAPADARAGAPPPPVLPRCPLGENPLPSVGLLVVVRRSVPHQWRSVQCWDAVRERCLARRAIGLHPVRGDRRALRATCRPAWSARRRVLRDQGGTSLRPSCLGIPHDTISGTGLTRARRQFARSRARLLYPPPARCHRALGVLLLHPPQQRKAQAARQVPGHGDTRSATRSRRSAASSAPS